MLTRFGYLITASMVLFGMVCCGCSPAQIEPTSSGTSPIATSTANTTTASSQTPTTTQPAATVPATTLPSTVSLPSTIQTTTPPPPTTQDPPATTTPTVTSQPVTTIPPAGNFLREMIDYPDDIWPIFNIDRTDNNFWMTVFYPADFYFEHYRLEYGVQYSTKSPREDVFKYYHDLVESHDLIGFADVQGEIGNWTVICRIEDSFYGGCVVTLLISTSSLTYDSNPYFSDYPENITLAMDSFSLMSEQFHCWPDSLDYERRYKFNMPADDVIRHYREALAGASNYTGTAGSITRISGILNGYSINISISSVNNTVNIGVEDKSA
ncbi:MAG: hypothetical protein JW954_01025 [Dehalococcoidaceae bacterium]|nr:hypothetical protein [Dehalococcoidaceae bacterium]